MITLKQSFRAIGLFILITCMFLSALNAATHPRELTYPEYSYSPPDGKTFRYALPNGLVMFIAEDDTLPIIDIRLFFKFGTGHDPADLPGLTHITSHGLINGGNKKFPGHEFLYQLDMMGAEITVEVEDVQTELHLSGLSRDKEKLLNHLYDMLLEPAFEKNGIEKTKAQYVQKIKNQSTTPFLVGSWVFRQLVFGTDHALARIPTPDKLKKITVRDLREQHGKFFHPNNAILCVSGDFDRTELISKLRKKYAGWVKGSNRKRAFTLDKVASQPGVYILPMKLNQGFIQLGHFGVKRRIADFPTVAVMSNILGSGSFTSRIMRRVRSDEGLAYSAGAYFNPIGQTQGLFIAYTQTKSESVPYALEIIKEELKKIGDTLPTLAEVSGAREGLRDSIPGNFMTKFDSMGTFAQLELYHLPLTYYHTLGQKYEKTSPKKVKKVGRKYIKPEQMIILVVGDPDTVQKGDGLHKITLSDFGMIKVLPPFTLD